MKIFQGEGVKRSKICFLLQRPAFFYSEKEGPRPYVNKTHGNYQIANAFLSQAAIYKPLSDQNRWVRDLHIAPILIPQAGKLGAEVPADPQPSRPLSRIVGPLGVPKSS